MLASLTYEQICLLDGWMDGTSDCEDVVRNKVEGIGEVI
jgi:hypothetical protein